MPPRQGIGMHRAKGRAISVLPIKLPSTQSESSYFQVHRQLATIGRGVSGLDSNQFVECENAEELSSKANERLMQS